MDLDSAYQRDFLVIEDENNGIETEMHVREADVGITDHCLTWTESQQTKAINNKRGRGNCKDGE